ncbi:unnamed protein product [marine sediment metagenome]|uniref:Uncharacterized protein n=1 Tax=marine sediment metagenome TaxID=412755 RepID=X1LEF1_9ZZZZ
MRDFSRIIPKHRHEDWMPKLSKIGNAQAIINAVLGGKVEGIEQATYSDYHGVGQLDTPYFIVVHGTFPSLTEAKVLVFNKEK